MSNDISGVSSIAQSLLNTVSGSAKKAAPQTQAAGADTTPTGTPATPVSELSSHGVYRNAAERIANTPVVDTVRVGVLREAVTTGQLQVDPTRVADKLITLEGLLSAKLDRPA